MCEALSSLCVLCNVCLFTNLNKILQHSVQLYKNFTFSKLFEHKTRHKYTQICTTVYKDFTTHIQTPLTYTKLWKTQLYTTVFFYQGFTTLYNTWQHLINTGQQCLPYFLQHFFIFSIFSTLYKTRHNHTTLLFLQFAQHPLQLLRNFTKQLYTPLHKFLKHL